MLWNVFVNVKLHVMGDLQSVPLGNGAATTTTTTTTTVR